MPCKFFTPPQLTHLRKRCYLSGCREEDELANMKMNKYGKYMEDSFHSVPYVNNSVYHTEIPLPFHSMPCSALALCESHLSEPYAHNANS